MSEKNDKYWMRRAIQLASHGWGHTSPNPMVGAVIVSADGRILGEGWHRQYGGPHAEVMACSDVRPEDYSLLHDATIYVTLEPCSHYGKTPPCAELIIRKGIGRCVTGCADPNPKVSGRGIKMLREAGIDVRENVLEEECMFLNRRFMTAQKMRRPWILLKWAESADGFIAIPDDIHHDKIDETSHLPVKLSTPVSAVFMHRIRAATDAILVGTNTILSDHPSLTTRLWPGKNPIPVIFDSARIPHDISLAGRVPLRLDTDISLDDNMHRLFSQHGITSLMVEGGRDTLQRFIDAGLYDEIRRERASANIEKGLKAPKF